MEVGGWRRRVIVEGFRFQRLVPLSVFPPAFRSRCELSAVLPAMTLLRHHGLQSSETISSIKCFLLEIALVMVLCHNNRKVTKTVASHPYSNCYNCSSSMPEGTMETAELVFTIAWSPGVPNSTNPPHCSFLES